MNKFLLILCLLSINTYANKNWIKIDSINNDNAPLKMYKPSSSYNYKKHSSKSKSKINPIDKELLDAINSVQGMARRFKKFPKLINKN